MLTNRDDALQMPARWYSVQWAWNRIFYGLVAGVVVTRGFDPSQPFLFFGSLLIIAAVVFSVLTVYALYYRRRWAREHDED
jgi:hypothetical protein